MCWVLYCCYCGSPLRVSVLQDRVRSKRESVRMRVRVRGSVRYGCLLLLLLRMRGSVLLRYSSGIGACAGSGTVGLLAATTAVRRCCRRRRGYGWNENPFVCGVRYGTVGTGIRSCAGYVTFTCCCYCGSSVRGSVLLLLLKSSVVLLFQFRFPFPSCSASSFLHLLLCLLPPRVSLVLL